MTCPCFVKTSLNHKEVREAQWTRWVYPAYLTNCTLTGPPQTLEARRASMACLRGSSVTFRPHSSPLGTGEAERRDPSKPGTESRAPITTRHDTKAPKDKRVTTQGRGSSSDRTTEWFSASPLAPIWSCTYSRRPGPETLVGYEDFGTRPT